MGHGTRGRAGRLLRAGALIATIGSVGCFSGEKVKKTAGPSAPLPLPSSLPNPTVPIPSAAAKSAGPAGGLGTLPPQPVARTSAVPPAFGVAQTNANGAMPGGSGIGNPTLPGTSAGTFPPPGLQSATATAQILPASTGPVSPPPGVPVGLVNALPPDPPVIAATPGVVPPTSTNLMSNVPPIPASDRVEVIAPVSQVPSPIAPVSTAPASISAVPVSAAPAPPSGGLVAPVMMNLGQ